MASRRRPTPATAVLMAATMLKPKAQPSRPARDQKSSLCKSEAKAAQPAIMNVARKSTEYSSASDHECS